MWCTLSLLAPNVITAISRGGELFLEHKPVIRGVETGYLAVIGLRDVMCHVAAVLERKAAGKVKCIM